MHRRNAAGRAIRTWKNHFVAGLCSTDTRFPMHLWDRLLEQASITLNLLRPSRRHPKISAYNMLEGTFDYNKTPLAPPGTKVIIHEKLQQRKTWDPHGTEGWYLGPAMEHHRCHRVFTNKTKAERITDTVEFFPQHTTVPSMTTDKIAIQAASDLIAAINQPTANTTMAPIGDKQMEAIRQIAILYQQHTLKQSETLPRVPLKHPTSFPRVAAPPSQTATTNLDTSTNHMNNLPNTHRNPTRQRQAATQEQAHHVITLQDDVSLPATPLIPTEVNWANAIIDPDTGASME
jgi:hypothetical protein